MKSFTNLFILFFILIVLGILYKKFEDKRMSEETTEDYETIQKYLLNLGHMEKDLILYLINYQQN